ncbi:hypothetical protein ACHAXH_006442 [Discostella pseudostelligera]
MKRRRCWFTALSYTLILICGLHHLLLPPGEIARIETTSRSRSGDTSHGGFRITSYYPHIKFAPSLQQQRGDNNVRISFALHDPDTIPLENVFNPYVTCPLGQITIGKTKRIATGLVRSGELPPALTRVSNEQDMHGRSRSGRVLDFTVTISTNLKLLFIGDSVVVQLAQAFDEMVTHNKQQTTQTRKVLWESWNGHDGGTIVVPTRGGGVSALWRMTGLLSRSRKGKPPANAAGGGWSDTEIDLLTNYSYDGRLMDNEPQLLQQQRMNSTTMTVDNFDVVILRVMHGWMDLHEITYARLVEAVELSHTLLGATTVLLMTVPFTNNVKTIEDMIKVNEINEVMRSIARDWHLMRETNVGGLQHILVVEYGSYYNHIIWSNGRHLGYNVTHPIRATEFIFETEGPDLLLDRVQGGGEWPPSIPMICSDTSLLGPDRRTCNRNYLFSDGMHVCPETLASRFAAGAACLLGCVYNNGQESSKLYFPAEEDIRQCERECNEQFLSVMPVEESLINTGTTLASFAA